ncbi:hypothetical protein FHY55_19540 [Oceanicola sp. D3]|uniref:hypothetical protein n=1 Tax=Oceanicola sp. D3 TaxID=2587163 RepID=UPI00112227E1|nr:hypothetical protein [Oceanicola sp. D3]QDC11291.1 hypothetical protein FHY55_19540 [Oceanicola sp. D3]
MNDWTGVACSPYVPAMPAGRPPIRAHPSKPFRSSKDAAVDGLLLLIRCNLCRRAIYSTPSDLMKIVDPQHPLHLPPFPCSRCGQTEYVEMRQHRPAHGDYGRIPIRKLEKVVEVKIWKNVMLGD